MSDSLPLGWHWATVGELAEQIDFGSSSKTGDDASGVPVLRMGNIQSGSLSLDKLKYLPHAHPEFPDLLLQQGDVLFNRTNSPELVGKSAVYWGVPAKCSFASYLLRLRLQDLHPQYFVWFVNSDAGRSWVASVVSQQVGQANVNSTKLKALRVPVPPTDVQRRIVAKLDALLAQTRDAREQLEAVPALVEKYRQSVLAAAFRGDLTAEWREQHPDVEPASKLLERIRVERRKAWEAAELAKMKAKGKVPKDDKWKGGYGEPAMVNAKLAGMPSTWAMAPLEAACDPVRGIPYGIVQTGDPVPNGVPTVRCGDIKNFEIDAAALKLVRPDLDQEYSRTRLRGGEVLLAIRGSVGEVAVAGVELAAANISREVALIPPLPGLDPRFLMYFLSSPGAQEALFRHVKGVAQQGINLSDVRSLAVPVTSLDEQREVVVQVDSAFRKCNALIEQARTLGHFELLERSMLSKAFRGELV